MTRRYHLPRAAPNPVVEIAVGTVPRVQGGARLHGVGERAALEVTGAAAVTFDARVDPFGDVADHVEDSGVAALASLGRSRWDELTDVGRVRVADRHRAGRRGARAAARARVEPLARGGVARLSGRERAAAQSSAKPLA